MKKTQLTETMTNQMFTVHRGEMYYVQSFLLIPGNLLLKVVDLFEINQNANNNIFLLFCSVLFSLRYIGEPSAMACTLRCDGNPSSLLSKIM